MNLDQESANQISDSAYNFFQKNQQKVSIPTNKDLNGFLVLKPEQSKLDQIRLLKTEDPEKKHVYMMTWNRLATISEPVICPKILEIGDQDGEPYYISEIPKGEPVSQFIHNNEPLPCEIAAQLTYDFLDGLISKDPLMYQEYGMAPESLWLVQKELGEHPRIEFGDYTINPTDKAEASNYQLCLDLLKYLSGNPPFDESFQELSARIAKGPATLQNLIDYLKVYIGNNPPSSAFWTKNNLPKVIHNSLKPEAPDNFDLNSDDPNPELTSFSDETLTPIEPETEQEDAVVETESHRFTPNFDDATEELEVETVIDESKHYGSVYEADKNPRQTLKDRLLKPFFTLVTIAAAAFAMLYCFTGGDLGKIKTKISQYTKKPSPIETKLPSHKTMVGSTPKHTPIEPQGSQPKPKPTTSETNSPLILPNPQKQETSSPSTTAYQPEKISIPDKPADPLAQLLKDAEVARKSNNVISAINSELIYLENTPNSTESKQRLAKDLALLSNSSKSLSPSDVEVIKRAAFSNSNAHKILITHFRKNRLYQEEIAALVAYSKTGLPNKLAEAGRRMMTQPTASDTDKTTALEYYKQAADQGDSLGQYYAGEALILGLCGPKNESQGIVYLSQAVSQRNHHAMDLLGVCYVRSWGVTKDDNKAIALFQSAIDLGNIPAHFNLGIRYAEGDKQNLTLAGETFQKGAELGEVNCMFILARCYLAGYGRPENAELAEKWFKEAAKNGNSDAMRWCDTNQINWNL